MIKKINQPMFITKDFLIPTTHDHLLDGQLILEQPTQGYRVAIDPVFLAAYVPVQSHHRVLDVGCGVGAAMLCLAKRSPQTVITGIEIQRLYAQLSQRNIDHNGFNDRLQIITGDIKNHNHLSKLSLQPSSFHQVMTNPPYFLSHRSTLSSRSEKVTANMETTVSLQQWIDFCLLMLKDKGTLTLIFPTERLVDLLNILHKKVGDITLYPLWPNAHKPAKRTLIRVRKLTQGATRLLPGCILHKNDGQFTDHAEAILRLGQAIEI